MRQRLDVLQAGRGVAALAVVACHANSYAPTASAFELGRYGVHFFFLLSGYVIFLSAQRSFEARNFLIARARRIYLPYWPIGIFAALSYAALGRDFDWLASLTLLPGTAALIPAWTLQHEIAFYALAALFFATGAPIRAGLLWGAVILLRQLGGPLNEAEAVLLGPINLLFVAGMIGARYDVVPDIRLPRALTFLGDASYSVYLAHLPAMGLLWRMGASFPMLVAGGIAAGIAYHFAAERPLMHRSPRTLSRFRASRPSRTPSQSYQRQPAPSSNG